MRRFTHALTACLSIFVLAFFADSADAQTTQPATTQSAKGYTQADFITETTVFHRKTLVDAYQQVGSKDARWDEQANAFLELMVRSFAAFWMHDIHRPADLPTFPGRLAAGKKLMQLGCDDPMVLYCHAITLMESGNNGEALRTLRRAQEGFDKHAYPKFRQLIVASRYLAAIPPNGKQDDRQAVAATFEKLMADTFSAKAPGKVERTLLIGVFNDAFQGCTNADRIAFLQTVQTKEGAEPWLLNYLLGVTYTGLAWDARGSGWASTVTVEGAKGFTTNLAKAREHLSKAWKLDPSMPQAPTDMLNVVMGAGPDEQGGLQEWFDRALAAQIDFLPAYSNMLGALTPRWGGSSEEMLEIGLQAEKTQRYDTMVPYQLIYAMERINEDSSDISFYMRPEVYPLAMNVLARYGAAVPDPRQSAFYDGYQMGIAILNGKYDDAKTIFQKRGINFPATVFTRLGLQPAKAIVRLSVLDSPHKAEVDAADALAKGRTFDKPLAAFEDLLKKLPADDKARPYVAMMAAELNWQLLFEKGDWVDLMPDAQLTGWTQLAGRWSIDNGKLVGEVGPYGLGIVCNANFGHRYEFTAKMEVDDLPGPYHGAGIVAAYTNEKSNWSILLYPMAQWGGVRLPNGYANYTPQVPVSPHNSFSATNWNGQIFGAINGTPVMKQPYESMAARNQRFLVGLGGYVASSEPLMARYSEIKIRKLTTPPPTPKAADAP